MGDADRESDKEETLDAVRHALSGLRFGSVEIIVHDSKVVQIERKEKLRLNHEATRKGGV
jgi:hypothetical protein